MGIGHATGGDRVGREKRNMTDAERAKVYRLCCESKSGQKLSHEEFKFLEQMFTMDQEGYSHLSCKASEDVINDYRASWVR